MCRETDVRVNTDSRKWYSTLYSFGNFATREYGDSTNDSTIWRFGKMTNLWNDVSGKWWCVNYRGVRVPDKFGYPMFGSGQVFLITRNNQVPEIIEYPAATSDIRINRVCDATRAFDVTCCNVRKFLGRLTNWKNFWKFVSTKSL